MPIQFVNNTLTYLFDIALEIVRKFDNLNCEYSKTRFTPTQVKPLQRSNLNCQEVCGLYKSCGDRGNEREICRRMPIYERFLLFNAQ